MLHGRIVTFQIMMKDEPGILSQVLNFFADSGANILTINQGLPINGCAVVTVNAETSGLRGSLQELLAQLNEAEGVLRGGDPGRLTAQAIEYRTKDGNKPW
mgnify:CR=1 FL=1